MKKKRMFYAQGKDIGFVQKNVLKMKLTLLFLLLGFLNLMASESYSQLAKLTISLKNVTVEQVLSEIEDNSEFNFVYNRDAIDLKRKVDADYREARVNNILDDLFEMTDVKYHFIDRIIVLSTVSEAATHKAQPMNVSGKVTDSSGLPLPGVSVVIKGTTNGTVTNGNGEYSLTNIPNDATLQFSFVGMKTQEISVAGKSSINVNMEEDAIGIEEVVAVGYGTMRKIDLTGSVSQVKADDLVNVSVSNPSQALQGRVAGLSVMTDNRPGYSPTIRIRGNSSIQAGNSPLIVVDGFPLVDADLSDINPNDIMSLEVLKDASSTAIYGSRGANGIILITTKEGAEGKNNLSVNSYYGFQSPTRLIETIGRDEFISFINEAYTYNNGKPVYSDSYPAPDIYTDWQDEIFEDYSSIQEHSFTFNGGNKKTSYLFSGSIFSQDGLRLGAGFKRLTARNNIKHKFSDWLTVGSHMQVSYSVTETRNTDTYSGWAHSIFASGWPTIPVKDEDGSWYYASQDLNLASYLTTTWNPVADANETSDQTDKRRVLGDFFAEFTLAKGLTFRSNFGVDLSSSKNYVYFTSEYADYGDMDGYGSQAYVNLTTKITENILNYAKSWDKHRFTATGVYSYQDYLYEDINLSGSGFPNDITGANNMSLADAESVEYSTDKYTSKLISWTARATYAYDDKYLLTVTGRYDGSSRFGANNKWGFFPSVGMGWRIINEGFMKDDKTFSNLKLRASYGITGNQEIGNYNSIPQISEVYYVSGDSPILGLGESLGNSDLRWEKTTQYDIGLDIGLWNRLDITIDYYKQNTTDLLYNVPIPTTSGYKNMLQNIGEVENQGFELTADARILDRLVKWDINANFSTNKNKIVELYGDVEEITRSDSKDRYSYSLIVGEPVNGIWAREFLGIITTQEQLDAYKVIRSDAQLGEEMYADNDGDEQITNDDFVFVGTTEPDFFYGISTNLSYKNFSLYITGQGAYGIATKEADYIQAGEHQIGIKIPTKYAYDRMWSEDNPNGSFPRAGAIGSEYSDATNGNMKYFIIKNIKLSYNLKSSWLKNMEWLNNLTIYANAQNYLNFSNFRGYNPENGSSKDPLGKALIFGLNVKF